MRLLTRAASAFWDLPSPFVLNTDLKLFDLSPAVSCLTSQQAADKCRQIDMVDPNTVLGNGSIGPVFGVFGTGDDSNAVQVMLLAAMHPHVMKCA